MRVRNTSVDPFVSILSPPPDESPEQKEARQRAEEEALRISDSIDDHLRREQSAVENQKPVKVLLLGQSESGKSAVLKSFLLHYARHEWAEDRRAWRVVVFLNLIRSIVRILDLLLQEMSQFDDLGDIRETDHTSVSDSLSSSYTLVDRFTDEHSSLILRLAPLRKVQVELEKMLGPEAREVHATSSEQHKKNGIHSSFGSDDCDSAFEELQLARKDSSYSEPVPRRKEETFGISDVLDHCRNDMKCLWEDPVVQEILSSQNARIEDSSGFFLNDIDRITSSDYEPTDDDIIRARLRTTGVREYNFAIEGREWVIYDVGGTRSFRASHFDDVNVIIFISPISCFDERLPENPKVNRLQDSYQLWRTVCSSQMLAKAQVILLLNKCDILREKLLRGVHVKDFITSFGDRMNDTSTVMHYFSKEFKDVCRLVSPEPRLLSIHFGWAIDTKTTVEMYNAMEDFILREQLKRVNLLG